MLTYIDDINDIYFVASEDKVAGLTDWESTSPNEDDTVDEQRLERFILFAESWVESYLREYELPLKEVPEALKWAILYIALYMMMERSPNEVPENIQETRDSIIAWLQSGPNFDALLEDQIIEYTGSDERQFDVDWLSDQAGVFPEFQ